MAMVLMDGPITLEIPTFDFLVLTAAEQQWMARTHIQTSNGRNMSCEGGLESSRGHIPDLNGTISGSRSEPFVARVHRYSANPTTMRFQNSGELPRARVFKLSLSQVIRGQAGRLRTGAQFVLCV